MRKIFLFLSLLQLCHTVFSQENIKYQYDSAGNQIYRCKSCVQDSLYKKKKRDTLYSYVKKRNLIVGEKMEESDFGVVKEIGFGVYPNPVSHRLKVHWNNNDKKYIIRIYLFSIYNKFLFVKEIKKEQESLEVDFSRYALGIYYLKYIYNTGEKGFCKVIKK